MAYVLEQSQEIAASLDEVFAFFSDPANLARITPAWLSFRIHGETPTRLRAGSRIEYRISWGPAKLRWVTRIESWAPPKGFTDVQERGPTGAGTTRTGSRRHPEAGPSSWKTSSGTSCRSVRSAGSCTRSGCGGSSEIFEFRRRAIEKIFPDGGEARARTS